MRRTALLGPIFALTLALPGCTGVDDFLDHTFSLTDNPNRPIGDSLNMRRVQGMSASAAAVTPQTGNVWPRGVDRMPTLQDIESDRSSSPRPANSRPANPRVGNLLPAPQGLPDTAPSPVASTPPQPGPPSASNPTDTSPIAVRPERYRTVSTPAGTDIVVPNGNGTATLMRSNGTMETVPNPR